MTAQFWHSFFEDTRTQIVLLLIALDFVLGAISALIHKDFRLSYLADFARNDVVGKVLPFAVLYLGYKYASSADIVIPGIDLEVIMNATWAIVLLALTGSLLHTLKELFPGLLNQAPDQIFGPDPETAGPATPPTP